MATNITAADPTLAIQVENLTFAYKNVNAPDSAPVLEGVELNLPRGSRCILVGANGAGEQSSGLLPLVALSRGAVGDAELAQQCVLAQHHGAF